MTRRATKVGKSLTDLDVFTQQRFKVAAERWMERPPTRLQRLDTRCPGSLGQVSRPDVIAGATGCEVCGHIVNICQHPDGGPGPFVCEHDLEGAEL